MRTITLLVLFFSGALCIAQKKQVCFTIDDLPVVGSGVKSEDVQKAITGKIVLALTKHAVPATGFVNEFKLYKANQEEDTMQVNLLRSWLDAGLDLGNHGFSHLNYNKVSCNEYFNDIIKGEKLTRPLLTGYGKSPVYFRHPFLHTGASKEKADSLSSFLTSAGYKPAPVTIDNADWIFALAYDSAVATKDPALMKTVGASYLSYMQKKLKYYEGMSVKLFRYNIRHILLIHSNAINAGYLDELAAMYEKNGYEFISLQQALEDPAYTTRITAYGRWGISWLDRWALSAGKKSSFFSGDPAPPQFIMKLAKTTEE